MLAGAGERDREDLAVGTLAGQVDRRVLHRQLRAEVAVDPLDGRVPLGDRPLRDEVEDVRRPVLHGRVADPRAHGEILSIAFAGAGQHQDAGGKIVHAAPNTTSNIFAKSISKDGGRGSYRGLLEVAKGAHGSKSKVVCDALLLDDKSRSDTYPTIRIGEDDVDVGHEATVSKVGEEQLFYLMTHGLNEEEASKLIVNGFIEPIVKELPMEYAVEMNRLIELQMEGSIG